MLRNSWPSVAPSTRAASSRSRSTPGDPRPRREDEERRRDERLGQDHREEGERDLDPQRRPASRRTTPRRPKASRSASPATDGGRTIGRSTTASSSREPRNRRRASTKASGSPKTTVSDEADRGRHQAQGERIEDDRRGERSGERSVEDRPDDEGEHRKAQEERRRRPPGRTGPSLPGAFACEPVARDDGGTGRNDGSATTDGRLVPTARLRMAGGTRARRGSPARRRPRARSGRPRRLGVRARPSRPPPPYVAGTFAESGDRDRGDLRTRPSRRSRRRSRRRPRRARSWTRRRRRCPPSRRCSRRTSPRSRPGSRVCFARFATSWFAYFVIGTVSPAAMTLTPALARSAGLWMPAGLAVGTMTVSRFAGELGQRARGQALVDELLRVGRVGRQEDVGRGALLDLRLEGRGGVGRDGQGRSPGWRPRTRS